MPEGVRTELARRTGHRSVRRDDGAPHLVCGDDPLPVVWVEEGGRPVLAAVREAPPAWRRVHAGEAFARIHASTTPAQRAQAVRVLKGYEADLRALASQR